MGLVVNDSGEPMVERDRLGPNARAGAVVAGATIITGCLPSLGFYSAAGLSVVGGGTLLALGALTRPRWLSRVATQAWPRRLLASAGPLLLLFAAYCAALDPQPRPLVFPLFLLAMGLLAVGLLRPAPDDLLAGTLPGLLVLAAGAALLHTKLMYVDNRSAAIAVTWAWLGGLLLALLGLGARWRSGRAFRGVLLSGLLVVGLVVRGGAIVASPEPLIDVHALLVQGPRALLHGGNPYAMALDSPYGTPRAIARGLGGMPADPDPAGYPPGIYLCCLPAVALGLDPRWLIVLAWLVLAGVLCGRAWGAVGESSAVLLAGLVLLFPSASFTAEQSWFDLVYVLFIVLSVSASVPWLGGLLLGFGATVKQTALFCLPAALIRWRRQRVAWAVAGVALLAVVLPFLCWNPYEFIDDILLAHLRLPTADLALGLPAMLQRVIGWHLSTGPFVPLVLVFASVAAWRARRSQALLLLSAGIAVALFSLLNRRAFLNYYEAAAVLLVVAAGWPDELPGKAAPE